MFRVTRSSHVFFYEDAVKAAKELEVNLTPGGGKEGPGIPQLVVPSYAADACIQRLLQKGHRVAICDQVKDRPEAEGPARRQAKGKNGRAVNIGEAA
jgi:DNA mismatch repair protein MutS